MTYLTEITLDNESETVRVEVYSRIGNKKGTLIGIKEFSWFAKSIFPSIYRQLIFPLYKKRAVHFAARVSQEMYHIKVKNI